MASPYQQLNYSLQPQAAGAPAAMYEEECGCGNNCGGCCPTPKCCIEPNCCSRVGKCPCFCTSYSAVFSVALSSIWLSLLLLILAQAIPDMYEATLSLWGYNSGPRTVWLGMWQGCGYGVQSQYSYSYGCSDYHPSSMLSESAAFGGSSLLNAVRVPALLATLFTALAGIVGAIRLAAQQRSKPASRLVNIVMLVSGALAFVMLTISFGASFGLYKKVNSYYYNSNSYYYPPSRGSSFALLAAAFGFLVIGVSMHSIAYAFYRSSGREQQQQSSEQQQQQLGGVVPDNYAAVGGYPAAPTVFSHPVPQYMPQPQIAYPTASAVPLSSPMHAYGGYAAPAPAPAAQHYIPYAR